MCIHCGVSSVSGMENGTEEDVVGMFESEGVHRVYRLMLHELNSIRRFPSDSTEYRVTELFCNSMNQIHINNHIWTYRLFHSLTGIPLI